VFDGGVVWLCGGKSLVLVCVDLIYVCGLWLGGE